MSLQQRQSDGDHLLTGLAGREDDLGKTATIFPWIVQVCEFIDMRHC